MKKIKSRLPSSGGNKLGQLKTGVEWTLESGRKVTFKKKKLSYDEVKEQSEVDFAINGREQEFLNEKNLSDLETMQYQQFYPVIVNMTSEGRYNFLDGSRRKSFFLLREGEITHLDALVSEDVDIEPSDAKALAKALQSAREHTLYEIGLRAKIYQESGLKQEEIAQKLGYSRPKIVRALQAASVSKGIYRRFDDINELTVKDYAELYKLNVELEKRDDSAALIDMLEIGNVDSVLTQLKQAVKTPKKKSSRATVEILAKFNSKDKYAKKRSKGRSFGYDFAYLTKAEEEILDHAIQEALDKITTL